MSGRGSTPPPVSAPRGGAIRPGFCAHQVVENVPALSDSKMPNDLVQIAAAGRGHVIFEL